VNPQELYRVGREFTTIAYFAEQQHAEAFASSLQDPELRISLPYSFSFLVETAPGVWGKPELPPLTEQQFGTHASHCCPLHGCKYNDEDRCPIETGLAKPTYGLNNGCEYCEYNENRI